MDLDAERAFSALVRGLRLNMPDDRALSPEELRAIVAAEAALQAAICYGVCHECADACLRARG